MRALLASACSCIAITGRAAGSGDACSVGKCVPDRRTGRACRGQECALRWRVCAGQTHEARLQGAGMRALLASVGRTDARGAPAGGRNARSVGECVPDRRTPCVCRPPPLVPWARKPWGVAFFVAHCKAVGRNALATSTGPTSARAPGRGAWGGSLRLVRFVKNQGPHTFG